MSATEDKDARMAALEHQIKELEGLSLATGVILTQLLQTIMKRELSPQRSATDVIENARSGIEAFIAQAGSDPIMKERALAAVKQYEDQIRSVLPI